MARRGKEFELAYKWLYGIDENKYKITSPANIYDKAAGRKREVDVLIEYNDQNGILRKIAVECRDRKKVQDSMWIEQLKTKREDLELDYIIAITTNKFSRGAINKARYHGIIIEEAEYLDKSVIDNISKEFMIDLLFIKFEVLELNFFIDYEIVTYKDLFSRMGLIDRFFLLDYLNHDYYYSIDPNSIMEQTGLDKDYCYKHSDDGFMFISNDIVFNENCPNIIKKIGISRMYIKIRMVPHKTSLSLNKSLSVFTVDPKKNKKYSAFFGSEDENIVIGYLNDGEVFHKIKLKNRKYYRLIGANMKINTIFPNGLDNSKINMEELVTKGLGQFDLSKLI